MNLAQEARERLGLTPEEFALLLGVPPSAIEDWEELGREPQGVVHSLLILLTKMPSQCAQTLVEYQLNQLPAQSPDRSVLATIARKIQGCHVA